MSYTLKIVSRMLDQVGQPQTQVWFPGVRMVSRVAQLPLQEMLGGAWQAYGQTDYDFVTPSIGTSWRADQVHVGARVLRRGKQWVVTGSVAAVNTNTSSNQMLIDFESPSGELGENELYDFDEYLQEWVPAQEIIQFNPPVTLLWVTLPEVSVHMIAEQAFLLGPDGGTIDRITGPGY